MNTVTSNPDNRPRSTTALFVLSPIAIVAAVIISFMSWLSTAFIGGPEPAEEITTHSVTFLLAVGPAVALLVTGLRVRRSPKSRVSSATVVGVILIIVGALVTLPMLIGAIAGQVRIAVLRAQPLTAAETEYTPAELRMLVDTFLDDTTSGLPQITRPPDASSMREEQCTLSNLSDGVYLTTLGELYRTDATAEAAIAVVRDVWTQAGRDVQTNPSRPGVSFTADGVFDYVSVVWVEAADPNKPVDYNLDFVFDTVCVAP